MWERVGSIAKYTCEMGLKLGSDYVQKRGDQRLNKSLIYKIITNNKGRSEGNAWRNIGKANKLGVCQDYLEIDLGDAKSIG